MCVVLKFASHVSLQQELSRLGLRLEMRIEGFRGFRRMSCLSPFLSTFPDSLFKEKNHIHYSNLTKCVSFEKICRENIGVELFEVNVIPHQKYKGHLADLLLN